MSEIINFKQLGEQLLRSSSILSDLLPGGKIIGKEWKCGDIYGSPGGSFGINMETGVWNDFSQNQKGGDLIALYAMQNNLSQKDAAIFLRDKYLGSDPVKYEYKTKPPREKSEIVKPPSDAMPPKFYQNQIVYPYHDTDGSVLFYIIRGEKDGKKFFYPFSFSSKGEWVKKHYPEPPLYNLHEILQNPDKHVVIVEGEKAAEAARILMPAYIPTTWPAGVNNIDKADWSVLDGRNVLLWPDADEPGITCMSNLMGKLSTVCSEIKIINTDKKDGWDAADAVSEGYTWGRFIEWAKPLLSIYEPPKEKEPQQLIELKSEMPDIQEPAQEEPEDEDAIPTDEFPAPRNLQMWFWEIDLQFSDINRTKVVMNASNVVKIIRAAFPHIVWKDTFYNKIFTKWVWKKQTEGEVDPDSEERQWSDKDTNNLYICMQQQYGLAKITKGHIEDALLFVAEMNKRNEPQEWLNSLEWDGKPRIESFFNVAMGVRNSNYVFAVSKNFWISMVARVLNPGCKADEMVVLEGPQGTYKTTSLELIGGKWYGEVNSEIGSKDFDQGLRGKMLVEFGELANMRKTDVETIKRKLSTRVDEYRSSYGRNVEAHPRVCIFVGTTNQEEYLKDPTGNRRFWPIKIKKADTEYIKENRDQLFAEAVACFKRGDPWHVIPWKEAEEERASRREYDEWEHTLSDIMEKNSHQNMNSEDVWVAMGGSVDKFDRNSQVRMASVMKTIGFKRKTIRVGNIFKRVWGKKKEDEDEQQEGERHEQIEN